MLRYNHLVLINMQCVYHKLTFRFSSNIAKAMGFFAQTRLRVPESIGIIFPPIRFINQNAEDQITRLQGRCQERVASTDVLPGAGPETFELQNQLNLPFRQSDPLKNLFFVKTHVG